MSEKIRVLLLVAEAWRLDDSGGNTLNNFVEGMDGVEFAQIYCEDRMPDNAICKKYFQISEREVLRNLIRHKKVGKRLVLEELNNDGGSFDQQNVDSVAIPSFKQRVLGLIRKWRPDILITVRRIIWLLSNWKTKELESFIKEFSPDVIYAPCYADPFQLKLTRFVKELTKCKIVTWTADDCYSLRHFSLDPFFWINRLWIRHCLRKTYPFYDMFFSISEDEARELELVVGKRIGIMRKGVKVPEKFESREIHTPIKIIYAGGLYLNRNKILIKIANALRTVNKNAVKAELHIYSGSTLNAKEGRLLNDGRTTYYHGLIAGDELKRLYHNYDIAIHCESFNLKYRLLTRLSFSTKIIDCFQSGCAILAIAWEEHTGMKFLKKEDAAICITNLKEIDETIIRLVNKPDIIRDYAQKAYECEKKNLRIEDVQATLKNAFVQCVEKNKCNII